MGLPAPFDAEDVCAKFAASAAGAQSGSNASRPARPEHILGRRLGRDCAFGVAVRVWAVLEVNLCRPQLFLAVLENVNSGLSQQLVALLEGQQPKALGQLGKFDLLSEACVAALGLARLELLLQKLKIQRLLHDCGELAGAHLAEVPHEGLDHARFLYLQGL